MQIRRDCFLPTLSASPPQKKAPAIIPRYTMLPATHRKQRNMSEIGSKWHMLDQMNKRQNTFQHFIWEKISLKNTSFRIHKSPFKLESTLCGLTLAVITNDKDKRRNSDVLARFMRMGTWWAGTRSFHTGQSWSLTHGHVAFGPNAQLSTQQGQDGRLSQGLPGQSGSLSLLQISACSRWLGQGQTLRDSLEDSMGSFSLVSPKSAGSSLGRKGRLGKVGLETTRVNLKQSQTLLIRENFLLVSEA